MLMVFTIWDTESANVIDSFSSEAEALEEIRLTVASLGREAVATWVLAARDPSGRRWNVASGEDLISRAFGIAA
jgi:hypothetical protein